MSGCSSAARFAWHQRQCGHIGAQSNYFHNFGFHACRAVSVGNLVDFRPPRRGDEFFEQFVGEVECGESTDPVPTETVLRVGDELLCVLDQRAV